MRGHNEEDNEHDDSEHSWHVSALLSMCVITSSVKRFEDQYL